MRSFSQQYHYWDIPHLRQVYCNSSIGAQIMSWTPMSRTISTHEISFIMTLRMSQVSHATWWILPITILSLGHDCGGDVRTVSNPLLLLFRIPKAFHTCRQIPTVPPTININKAAISRLHLRVRITQCEIGVSASSTFMLLIIDVWSLELPEIVRKLTTGWPASVAVACQKRKADAMSSGKKCHNVSKKRKKSGLWFEDDCSFYYSPPFFIFRVPIFWTHCSDQCSPIAVSPSQSHLKSEAIQERGKIGTCFPCQTSSPNENCQMDNGAHKMCCCMYDDASACERTKQPPGTMMLLCCPFCRDCDRRKFKFINDSFIPSIRWIIYTNKGSLLIREVLAGPF